LAGKIGFHALALGFISQKTIENGIGLNKIWALSRTATFEQPTEPIGNFRIWAKLTPHASLQVYMMKSRWSIGRGDVGMQAQLKICNINKVQSPLKNCLIRKTFLYYNCFILLYMYRIYLFTYFLLRTWVGKIDFRPW
jgi:hypothetical protein